MGNLNLNFKDVNNNILVGKKVLFTPVLTPNISSSYLSIADSEQFITNAAGNITGSLVEGKYKVEVAMPLPASIFYININETRSSLISSSLVTGSVQDVFFNLIDIVKDPFSVKSVNITPTWNYPASFSGSLYLLNTTSSKTSVNGTVVYSSLLPGILQVDAIGKVTTTFFISVPSVVNIGDGTWNAKDLLIVKPKKGISVKLHNLDNSYVLTVSSSDARYASKYGVNYNNESSSHSDNSDHSIHADTASYVLQSVSASFSTSSSYAKTASYVTGVVANSINSISSSFSSSSLSSSYPFYITSSGKIVTNNIIGIHGIPVEDLTIYSTIGASSKIGLKTNNVNYHTEIESRGDSRNAFSITGVAGIEYIKHNYAGGTLGIMANGGNVAINGSSSLGGSTLSVQGNISASNITVDRLFGTASYAIMSLSASYAPVQPAYSASVSSIFTTKQDNIVTGGTYNITSSVAVKSSIASSASWVSASIKITNADTSSYILPSNIANSYSSSVSTLIGLKQNTITNKLYVITASLSTSASFAPVQPAYSASVSSIFTTKQDNIVTGGTYNITSSVAVKAISASYSSTASVSTTASYALTASYVAGAVPTFTGKTNNYIPKWSSNTLTATSNVYDDGTNVGIGTNTPKGHLSIFNLGTSTSSSVTLSLHAGTDAQQKATSAATIVGGFKAWTSWEDAYLKVQTHIGNSTLLTDTATFTNGRVGIMTTDPQTTLHVQGNISASGITANTFTGTASIATFSNNATTAVNASSANSAAYASNCVGTSSYATSGSYVLTASYVKNAVSSSFATTASYIKSSSFSTTAGVASSVNFNDGLTTTSNVLFASVIANSIRTTTFEGNLNGNALTADNALHATNADTASYIKNAVSASYSLNADQAISCVDASTAEVAAHATTASYAITASYSIKALSASYAPGNPAISSSYSLTASYSSNASTAEVATIANGLSFTPTTASFAKTASYALTAGTFITFAKVCELAISASSAISASYALSSSNATTASYSINALSASWAPAVPPGGSYNISASWASASLSASYAPVQPSYSASIETLKQNTLVQNQLYLISSSYSINSKTASLATSASYYPPQTIQTTVASASWVSSSVNITTADTASYILPSNIANSYSSSVSTIFGTKQNSLTGTNNYLPKWSSNTLTATSNVYDDGTFVGVGTNTPKATLSLFNLGTSTSSSVTLSLHAGTDAQQKSVAAATIVGGFKAWTTWANSFLRIQTHIGNSNLLTDTATFTNGRMGIMTTDPQTTLHVQGNVSASGFFGPLFGTNGIELTRHNYAGSTLCLMPVSGKVGINGITASIYELEVNGTISSSAIISSLSTPKITGVNTTIPIKVNTNNGITIEDADIIPSKSTFDLGTTANKFQNIYINGNLFGTASLATFANNATTAVNASSANSAAYASNCVGTSSYATSGSYVLTASYSDQSKSSSYALTASYALNGGSGTGTALTTGSTYPITASWSNNMSAGGLTGTLNNTILPYTISVGVVNAGVLVQSPRFQGTADTSLQADTSSYILPSKIANSYSSSVSTLIGLKQPTLLNQLYNLTASTATSASYALTASYSLNGGSGTGTALTTGSTYPITASWSNNMSAGGLTGILNNAILPYTISVGVVNAGVLVQSPRFQGTADTSLQADTSSYILPSKIANNYSSSVSTLIGLKQPTLQSDILYNISCSYALNGGSGTGTSLTTGSTYPITASWSNNIPSVLVSSNNTVVGVGAGNGSTLSTTTLYGLSSGYQCTNITVATMVGAGAGQSAGYADSSTMVGYLAGYAAKTASYTTFIGGLTGPVSNLVDVSNSTAIGYNAKVTSKNQMALGGTGVDAVKVGINNNNPKNNLDVNGNISCSVITASLFFGNALTSTNGAVAWAYFMSNVSGAFNSVAGSGMTINKISAGIYGLKFTTQQDTSYYPITFEGVAGNTPCIAAFKNRTTTSVTMSVYSIVNPSTLEDTVSGSVVIFNQF